MGPSVISPDSRGSPVRAPPASGAPRRGADRRRRHGPRRRERLAERRDVPAGSLVHVPAGTPLQSVNHGDADLVVYAHGWPPEAEHAELLDSAV